MGSLERNLLLPFHRWRERLPFDLAGPHEYAVSAMVRLASQTAQRQSCFGRKILEIPDIYSSCSSLRMSRSSVCCRDPVRPAGGFVSLESRMKEDDESKGELRLIAVFLVLLALVVLRFFRR